MLKNSRASLLLLVLLVLLVTTGCQITQTPFTRTAGQAGAAFAAAATTLRYAHTGKIWVTYARSSFANYQSELRGLDQQLPSQQGAPGKQAIQQLLDVYKPAMQVVNRPCLDASCNWRAQVEILDRASKAFLEAAGQ
jgi:hypothetical protein